MKKRLASIIVGILIFAILLTGCTTKKTYEEEVAEIKSQVKAFTKDIDKVSSRNEWDDFNDDLLDALDEFQPKTKEGTELKKAFEEFWEDNSEDIFKGRNASVIKKDLRGLKRSWRDYRSAAEGKGISEKELDRIEGYIEDLY